MSGEISKMLALCAHVVAMETEKEHLSADLKRISESVTAAKRDIIAYMQEQGVTTIGDLKLGAELKIVRRPRVFDWLALYAHVAATGEWDLLYRRVAQLAYDERLKAGVSVPGVEPDDVAEVKVRAR